MGWSFGGIVTTLAVSGRSDFRAAIIQAPGALNWDRSPALREALTSAAQRMKIPIQCLVAENDRTTGSARAICEASKRAPAELKIYPPFTPTRPLRGDGTAPGHVMFGPQGVDLWKGDVLAFLDKHLRPPLP